MGKYIFARFEWYCGRAPFTNAASMTFYSLLALFPDIAALVSIYGLFADPSTIINHLDTISGFAPGGAIDALSQQLTRLAAQGSTTLGVGFIVGLAISLLSANSGIKALFDALNAVYKEKEKRSFIKLNAVTLTFTIGIAGSC
jgi:membrane protein